MEYNFKDIISDIKNGNYKLLGVGSCRRVYDLNDGFVIKIAKDIRGIYQNQIENKIYLSRKSNFFAQVIAASEDNRCIIMPKAEKIKNIYTVCKYYNVKSIKSLIMLDHLNDDITSNKLSKADLGRPSSWGFIGDVPVIIDYGLTHRIFKKYYGINSLLKRYQTLRY
ncbi:MAG: hypothetical protein ACYDG2_16675 [Ruminiclostridium sp.]